MQQVSLSRRMNVVGRLQLIIVDVAGGGTRTLGLDLPAAPRLSMLTATGLAEVVACVLALRSTCHEGERGLRIVTLLPL